MAYDNVNTVYADDYTLDARTLFLPTLRGYGDLPDLHIAMSQNEDLLDMVAEIATASVEDLLDPTFDAEGKVRAILYEWAGVTDVATDSRGPHLGDARMLEFLEEFMGKEYLQVGVLSDPKSYAAVRLEATFEFAYNEFFARLIAQTEAGSLLDGAQYDAITDTFAGFEEINLSVLSDIEGFADTSADPSYLWAQVARLVDGAVGFANLDVGDLVALQDAAVSSGTTINGTSGNQTINGTSDNDAIFGFAGNDALYGYAGNDTLVGGEGYDNLVGGTGNDIYVFSPDWGIATSSNPDFINESSGEGTDTIYLAGGITPSDIYFWTDSGNFWIQRIADADDVLRGTASSDANGTTISSYIERIVFESGTIWDLTQGLTMTDTDAGHTIKGASQDDVIYGNGGNDIIYGFAGDDIIVGGNGDKDTFYGGTGDDTYVFDLGFGNYTTSGQLESLTENAAEGTDTIFIRGALTPADIYFWTDGGTFYMQFIGDADDYLSGTAGTDTNGSTLSSRIETIVFESGTTWDLTQGLHLSGNGSNNSIKGAGTADTIDGNAGNDTIHAYAGNDIIYGGGGTDSLYGEDGADVFTFEASSAFSASDTIYDFNTGQNDAIDLSDVLDGFFTPGVDAITDFVQITTSSSNSLLKVDQDGTANGTNFVQIALISGVTGLTDEAALVTAGRLIVA